MRDILPNGLLGVAIAGLLAAFMAGMAANISAFNTVFSYDLWQRYIRKDHSDDYYLRIGRLATVGGDGHRDLHGHRSRARFSNVMDYLQTLFGFFNAPLFATFILGMFWKRMTATAGWVGLVGRHALGRARRLPQRGRVRVGQPRGHPAAGPGRRVRRGLGGLRRRHRAQRRRVARDRAQAGGSELRGLVYSETPREDLVDPEERKLPWYRRTLPARRHLARPWSSSSTSCSDRSLDMSDHHDLDAPDPDGKRGQQHTAGAFDIRNFIGALLGLYGLILTLAGDLRRQGATTRPAASTPTSRPASSCSSSSAFFIAWARIKPIVVPDARRARRRRPDPTGAEASADRPLTAGRAAARDRRGPSPVPDGQDGLRRLGRGWQTGQENDERFMNCSRRIMVPHRSHGVPARP